MKKFILKASIWFAVSLVGSMLILLLNGITDLKQLDLGSMFFGCFVGVMFSYIQYLLPDKK